MTLLNKNWTLGLIFDFSYGNDIYDLSGRDMETGFNCNVYGRNRDRWSESNPNGYYPKAGSAFTNIYDTYAGGEFNGGCSLYLHDGSYIRLKTLICNMRFHCVTKISSNHYKYMEPYRIYLLLLNIWGIHLMSM